MATPAIQTLTVQAYTTMGKTAISAFCSIREDTGPRTWNIGAALVAYPILELPTLAQVVWCLGDELKECYRELSSPKA